MSSIIAMINRLTGKTPRMSDAEINAKIADEIRGMQHMPVSALFLNSEEENNLSLIARRMLVLRVYFEVARASAVDDMIAGVFHLPDALVDTLIDIMQKQPDREQHWLNKRFESNEIRRTVLLMMSACLERTGNSEQHQERLQQWRDGLLTRMRVF